MTEPSKLGVVAVLPAWLAIFFVLLGGTILVLGALGLPRYDVTLPASGMGEAGGVAYNVVLPAPSGFLGMFGFPTDAETGNGSRLILFEDGQPMGPGHVVHDDIRANGAGRYSHWAEYLYFSASDNSNPALNGRVYTTQTPLLMPMWGWIVGALLTLLGAGRLAVGFWRSAS